MIQPVIITPDLERLRGFYADLLGAVETVRIPASGPTFYLGLRVGDAEFGLTANADVATDSAQRILLSVEVADVDELLQRVESAGGRVLGPATDMSWGQRVAHIQDPDGNSVNLTKPIGTR